MMATRTANPNNGKPKMTTELPVEKKSGPAPEKSVMPQSPLGKTTSENIAEPLIYERVSGFLPLNLNSGLSEDEPSSRTFLTSNTSYSHSPSGWIVLIRTDSFFSNYFPPKSTVSISMPE